MKALLTGAFVALLLTLAPMGAQAQTKLGFVDIEVIIQQMPEFKDVETQLKGTQKAYEDTLKMLQATFQERVDAYQKQQSLMNPETRQKEEANLNALREQFLQLQQAYFGQQGLFAQRQAQLLQPLKEKVRAAIERVAKDEKLTAVAETGVMVYYDKKLEITYKVLDNLRRAN